MFFGVLVFYRVGQTGMRMKSIEEEEGPVSWSLFYQNWDKSSVRRIPEKQDIQQYDKNHVKRGAATELYCCYL
jgi:hypothetical protein